MGWNYFEQSDYDAQDASALSNNDKGFRKIGQKFKKSKFNRKLADIKIKESSDTLNRIQLRSVRPWNITPKKPDKLFACIKSSGSVGKCVEVRELKYLSNHFLILIHFLIW